MSGGAAPVDEGGGGKKNSFGEQPESVELNLTALMDILSNLLFFLLASFGATVVMGINVTVPAQSSDSSSVADTGESVTVNLKIEKDNLEITTMGSAQNESDMNNWYRKIPNVGDGIDKVTLGDQLFALKTKYPKSDTVILLPEVGVRYAAMVAVMDAVRERRVSADGQPHMLPLFPTVVISTIVK